MRKNYWKTLSAKNQETLGHVTRKFCEEKARACCRKKLGQKMLPGYQRLLAGLQHNREVSRCSSDDHHYLTIRGSRINSCWLRDRSNRKHTLTQRLLHLAAMKSIQWQS